MVACAVGLYSFLPWQLPLAVNAIVHQAQQEPRALDRPLNQQVQECLPCHHLAPALWPPAAWACRQRKLYYPCRGQHYLALACRLDRLHCPYKHLRLWVVAHRRLWGALPCCQLLRQCSCHKHQEQQWAWCHWRLSLPWQELGGLQWLAQVGHSWYNLLYHNQLQWLHQHLCLHPRPWLHLLPPMTLRMT